jgi:thymidylate kinase
MQVIEFLGMPRAGKTTALEVMESYMKKEGAKVRTIYEGARICPLEKSDRYNYNSWSFHNTINRILESRLDGYDFILIDRGILDHMAFLNVIDGYIDKDKGSTFDYYKNFLKLQDKEIFFDANPDTAIKRECKHKPSEVVGSVFKIEFLKKLRDSYNEVINKGLTKELYIINGEDNFKKNLDKILYFSKKFLKGGN